MSKVRTIILKLFLVRYPVNLKLSLSLVPSMYSAQAIIHHKFLWKKCTLYSIKYRTHVKLTHFEIG